MVFIIPIEFIFLSNWGMTYDKYLTPAVLFGSISLTAVILQSEMRPPKAAYLRKPIEALGAATLTIFVANPLIIRGLGWLTEDLRPESPGVVIALAGSILLAAITCGIALALTALISKCRLKGILN